MIKMELIVKTILIMGALYVFAKAFGPSIGEFIMELFTGTKPKNNSDIDFDQMIEQKKAMMQLKGMGSGGVVNNAQGKKKGKVEAIIHKEYETLSKIKEKNNQQKLKMGELKKLMAMIESLQWGNGQDFEDMAKRQSVSLGVRIEASTVSEVFNMLLKREIFLDLNQSSLPLSQINSVINTSIVIKTLLSSEKYQLMLSKKWRIDTMNVLKGIARVLHQELYPNSSDLLTLSKDQIKLTPLTEPDLIRLIKTGNDMYLESKTLQEEIKAEALFFETLAPLPELKNKKDKETALKILKSGHDADLDQIKKMYKKLAREKHPDKLKGKGIPDHYDQIATENFTRIKEAYDILVSELKDQN